MIIIFGQNTFRESTNLRFLICLRNNNKWKSFESQYNYNGEKLLQTLISKYLRTFIESETQNIDCVLEKKKFWVVLNLIFHRLQVQVLQLRYTEFVVKTIYILITITQIQLVVHFKTSDMKRS